MRRSLGVGLVVLLWSGAVLAAQESYTRADCGECHDEAEEFAHGPHARLMSPQALAGSCVTCHGPAHEHMEDPVAENIRRDPGAEACATCHSQKANQLLLATPDHSRNQVTCLDCHASGHRETRTEFLLARPPQALCGECHGVERAAFDAPFAHREGGQPMACTECHSPHGLRRVARLSLLGNGGPCVECHSETAGPFVFPHPPREVEGCVSCHEPHGSTNPRLLHRRRIFNLCLECHTQVPSFHDLSQARFRACSSCHVAVHGSNREPRLFDD